MRKSVSHFTLVNIGAKFRGADRAADAVGGGILASGDFAFFAVDHWKEPERFVDSLQSYS